MRSRSLLEGFRPALALALFFAGTAGCGSPGIEPTGMGGGRSGGSPPGTGGGPGGGSNPGGTAGSPGGGPPGGQPPAPIPPGDPGTRPPPAPPSGGAGEEACSMSSAKAEPVPVDLYIMQDKSGSMMMPAQATNPLTKWDAVKSALTAFVQSPSTAGMNVGLGLFPADSATPSAACMMCKDIFCLLQCGCALPRCMGMTCTCGAWANAASCNTADYVRPVIAVDARPAASQRIVDALGRVMLSGGTPTRPALEGAIQYARSHEMMTGRRIAIALATDGVPTGCEMNPQQNTVAGVSQLARMAAMGGINTFVIGVGPALMDLNAIAMAGGTNTAYLVEGGNVDGLIAALKAIQNQASKLACSFAIPPPPANQTLDPNKVNVSFAPMGVAPSAATRIPRVANQAACGPMGGWYYNNPMMPTQVNLCEASCRTVNMSPNGELSLQFGCKSLVIE